MSTLTNFVALFLIVVLIADKSAVQVKTTSYAARNSGGLIGVIDDTLSGVGGIVGTYIIQRQIIRAPSTA